MIWVRCCRSKKTNRDSGIILRAYLNIFSHLEILL
jgi:hypothetical protein